MRGGGFFIAAGLIVGPIVGAAFGQTSIGLVAGFVIGAVAAIVLTIADRRRSQGHDL
nr:hypothetical protein [Polymorphobacter sp.]